jgi:hypothetical protein
MHWGGLDICDIGNFGADGTAGISRGIQEERPDRKRIGIIMNGVTGCMGYNQHLVRSIMAAS